MDIPSQEDILKLEARIKQLESGKKPATKAKPAAKVVTNPKVKSKK